MFNLPQNTSRQGRIIRIVVGLALTSLAFWGPSNPWFLLGLFPLAVGIIGWCPLYALCPLCSCSGSNPESKGCPCANGEKPEEEKKEESN
ncbi:MAG: DUF2892 domain-containing protein [Alphaproteobacteria bacterium]|nr:DUF2892 domain-containing protein [Alphaproteobacteria bacterium]